MGIRERFRKKFGLDQVTEDILNSGIMKAYLQDSGRLTGSLPEKGAHLVQHVFKIWQGV